MDEYVAELVKNITPMKDWVLLQLEKAGEEVIGGIVIVRSGGAKFSNIAKVLKVGPGRRMKSGKLTPMELAPGDKVYIANLGRCEFVKSGRDDLYLVMCAEPLIEFKVED